MQAHIYPIYPMVEAQALCFHHWVNAIMKFSLHRLRRIAPSGIGYHMTLPVSARTINTPLAAKPCTAAYNLKDKTSKRGHMVEPPGRC